jgi:hypothetical protein
MRLREAANRGEDIEAVLEQLQAEEKAYPLASSHLLGLRAYLMQLLTNIAAEWSEECQGLTNYVLALDEAAKWRASISGSKPIPLMAVTFNYDTLLEAACSSVLGVNFLDLPDYVSGDLVRVYKPHGSVQWRQKARWNLASTDWKLGLEALTFAIDQAASLEWHSEYRLMYHNEYQDDDGRFVWLPALAIPAQRKQAFAMPDSHLTAMRGDLSEVTTVVAIGWRGREGHFLKLLQECLPSAPGRLVAVAERPEAAQETVEALWPTGRFNRYAIASKGFSDFVSSPEKADNTASRDRGLTRPLRLGEVLTGAVDWITRLPGPGLNEDPVEKPFGGRRYVAEP